MYKGILHTHTLVVTLFLFIYVIKTILLLSGKNDLLTVFSKKTRVFEMIVSTLFLVTGIYLTMKLPFGGKFDYLFYIKVIMVLASIPIAVVGFKRSNKILAALSLLLITGSYGIAEVYAKRKGAPKESNTLIAANDGKALYENNCVLCHGADGKNGASGALNLSATTLDIPSIATVILNGRNTMNKVDMSAEQADAVAHYVTEHLKGH
ncbi:MAG: SirB2 family protein [bacterium]|nr:SirB2 family protein [bacterium]